MVTGLNFLQYLFTEEKLQHSAVNTARSALSAAFPREGRVPFGENHLVVQFMRGVRRLRPPKPKYTTIWKPETVLRSLENAGESRFLSTLQLARKLVVLLLLSTGLRGQTLLGLRTDRMTVEGDVVRFRVDGAFYKQNRAGWTPPPVTFRRFPNRALCPVRHLNMYLERTQLVRKGETALFLISQRPWSPASRATLRRWVLDVLEDAGVDVSVYGAGSTRSASTSGAVRTGAPLEVVLQNGGWSRHMTFSRFYDRPLQASATMSDWSLRS